jgi:aminoglycoside 6-adenylyltransferase
MTDDILARLTQWADNEMKIRAMLLTSSRANASSPVDRFSDYDIVLAVTEILPFFENREWLKRFGNVLVVYRDPIQNEFGCERFRYITQYEDGTKIDFTFWPVDLLKHIAKEPSLPAELDIGYSVLLDKDHLTDQLKPATHKAYIPAPPSAVDFQTLIEGFFQESTYVAKHVWRDDLMPLKYNLDHAMKQVCLRRMLEWRMEVDRQWSARPGDYGKGLKKLLPREIWEELEATYVGSGIESNWEALFKTISLFRKVANEVANHLGYRYPDELDQQVVKYLESVRRAEH